MPKQIAEWNTDLKLWGNSETDLLSERWEPFLETWPTSGTMRNGRVYELPMQERPTKDLESSSPPTLPTTRAQNGEDRNNKIWHRDASKPQNLENALAHVIFDIPDSSLLRSPTASQGQGGALGEAEARKRGNTVGIRDQAMDLAKLQGFKVSREADNLLPTPKALDGVKGNLKTSQERLDSGHQVDLPNIAIDLLGTPRANAANPSSKQVEAGAPKARLEDQVLSITWGKFEPAIRRWEAVLGRPAPAPTKPDGKEGNHRLSSKFTEWMMGLPDNWITGHNLKRNDELKLAGNGVVPQQAELALRMLLEDTPPRKVRT